ncbi:MAG: hypothetical protein IKJ78_04765 [Bacteroidales bacterium]|nr:hypothetical protein [Bacteroidales bacterium]
MKKYARILGFVVLAACVASMVFSACRKEMPEVEVVPPPPDTTYNRYNDDSTALEILPDTIQVVFYDSSTVKEWKTTSYTTRIVRDTTTNHFEWIYIEANMPDSTYPRIELKVLNEIGTHTGVMNVSTVVTPAGSYTIPLSLGGDEKCGNLFYYSNDSVMFDLHMPDGTVRADWWPLEFTTEVLFYDVREGRLTVRCSGRMFDYKQWFLAQTAGTPISIDAARVRNVKVSFGGLKINRD